MAFELVTEITTRLTRFRKKYTSCRRTNKNNSLVLYCTRDGKLKSEVYIEKYVSDYGIFYIRIMSFT